jgi:release factor glutamine methyltransferase
MSDGSPARDTARQAVRVAADRLREAGVPEPDASAEVLLAELLGVGRADLAYRREPLSPEQRERYDVFVARRRAREPVQRILGYAYFRNLKLWLNEETLIPRPDTESVVDAALEVIDEAPEPPVVLDVGTGTGAIAISIAQERPGCEVHATDISEKALQIARRNATENGARVRFHRADVVTGLDELTGRVGLLVSNPPYVGRDETDRLAPEVLQWDPAVALFSDGDGMHFYRRLFTEATPLLDRGAGVVVEVGDRQATMVLGLGEAAGFVSRGIRDDLAGTPRAVVMTWKP